jgi:hypothetical protein
MKRTVRVIEAYVPGLGERPEFWCEMLLENVSAALGSEGTEVAVLPIPSDETMIWLVWGQTDPADPESALVAAVRREAANAGSSVEVERTVDGVMVWHRSHDDRQVQVG